jgi:hypothetical protein
MDGCKHVNGYILLRNNKTTGHVSNYEQLILTNFQHFKKTYIYVSLPALSSKTTLTEIATAAQCSAE